MTSRTRRAFHLSGASWLLLCAIGNNAMAEDAAAPPEATPLPEITVTAPSPIVRHRTVPSRTTARVARAAPGRNRERPVEPPAPVAAAPQQGVLPVVTDQFATVTVYQPRKSAAPVPRHSAISCFPSPASPAPALRRAHRAGLSFAVSTSTASGSSRTALAAAAPPTSARTISYPSTPSRPTRSKSCADLRRCATARHRSAASSARPTTGFRMRCPPAPLRRSGATDCQSRRRWPMRNHHPA